MKHTLILLLTLLSTRAAAQISSAGTSTWSVEYAEARTTPYDCPQYELNDLGRGFWGDGPFVWWREDCGEYTQPTSRWNGQRWVKDPPCCMRYGGRRFVVIDKVYLKPLGLVIEVPRA